mmetsp:Transcript_8204/g.19795  ORF Transcript_8204/g.19795 Transcript_8204/m.19795 type:complete len:856 (+) Transcript_8204:1319-3886(+)
MTLLDSDADTDDDDLDLLLASDHLPPNEKQLDFIRSEEEQRNRRASEGSLKISAPMRFRPIAINRGDTALKEPPSYPSPIQRMGDKFTAEERRKTESKKQCSRRQNGEKSKRNISQPTPLDPIEQNLEMPDSFPDIDVPRTAVISSKAVETVTQPNESDDEDPSVHQPEERVLPAEQDSDATVSLESASFATREEGRSNSSLLKKKAPSDLVVLSSLGSTDRKSRQLGSSQDDAIVLSSDSEVEDEERKPEDDNSNRMKSEGKHPSVLDSASSRFPRKCKQKSWTNEEKRKYKKDHPCIGIKGFPLKTSHKGRKCKSCGFCLTCTSPPCCSKRELRTFKEEAGQTHNHANVSEDVDPNLATASSSTERRRQVASKSPTKRVSSKRKRSVDEKTSRKIAKACATRKIDEKNLMPQTPRPITLTTPANDAIEYNRSSPRYHAPVVREFEYGTSDPALGGEAKKDSSVSGVVGSVVEESPTQTATSTCRDSKKGKIHKLARNPAKRKRKKGKRKKKTNPTEQNDDAMKKNYLFLLAEKVKKLEKEVGEQKYFKTEIPTAPVKSEEGKPPPHSGINTSSLQTSATNFVTLEDFQLAMEAALQKMPIVENTPSATRGFAVFNDPRLKHSLEYAQNSQAVPDFNQSSQVVKTSEAEQISRATQTLRQAREAALKGNQDGKDVVNDDGDTGERQEPPRVATRAQETGRMEVSGSTGTTNEIAKQQDSRECNGSEAIAHPKVANARIRRLRQQKNDSGEFVNASIQRLRQQSNGSMVAPSQQRSDSSDVVNGRIRSSSQERSDSTKVASPAQHFRNNERSQILLLLLIILAITTTEPPILNGIVFVLVAFGIIMAEQNMCPNN